MKITAYVKARAKTVTVEKISDSEFRVSVKAPPQEGRANQAVCEAVADYLGLPKSRVRIVSGQTSKRKVLLLS